MITLRHLYLAQEGKCYLCGLPLGLKTATKEHFIPKNNPLHKQVKYNLLLAHQKCNVKKGSRFPTKKEVRVFHGIHKRAMEL